MNRSTGVAAMKIPLKPPITNIETKASAKHIAVVYLIEPPQTVPIQLNVLIADGTAMTIVENEKVAARTRFIPLTNMWCPQTMKPRTPMATMAKTIALYPKIGFRELTEMISDTRPMAGKIMM